MAYHRWSRLYPGACDGGRRAAGSGGREKGHNSPQGVAGQGERALITRKQRGDIRVMVTWESFSGRRYWEIPCGGRVGVGQGGAPGCCPRAGSVRVGAGGGCCPWAGSARGVSRRRARSPAAHGRLGRDGPPAPRRSRRPDRRAPRWRRWSRRRPLARHSSRARRRRPSGACGRPG